MSLLAPSASFPVTPAAAGLTIALRPAPLPLPAVFNLGAARHPDGTKITTDGRSLRRNDRPWTPVMGEFHFARYPAGEWREELLKLKAGGIDIVATYVFWIHHEESEGQWDWSGCRELRRFVATIQAVGLQAIVRCGPWCHGEVRNGGLPDWLLQQPWVGAGLKEVRSDHPRYLEKVRILYAEIARQLWGLLWKDGGPVVGVQLENEYSGPAQHLLTLKRLAREAGLDVPLYTRTGWPELQTPMPFGEILPLYGVYAEGFWDREIAPMPGLYWAGFHFSQRRTDANIANEVLGRRDAHDAPDVARYPYLTCEIGGGMMSSYHRRIHIDPADVEATTLVKLGSGGNSPGYYMYHGGTNPAGRLTTLMETQATPLTNWNDLPVLNYDFQAPLGAYGQIRPHYHRLRRLHLFLRDFGSVVGAMEAALPDERPAGRDDTTTLRWAVRFTGTTGLVFVNNHERLRRLPVKESVQFALQFPASELTFPERPIAVPEHSRFFWPFNFDLGHGVRLSYATAQPLCAIDVDGVRTVFFAEIAGIPAEFAIAGQAEPRRVAPGLAPALTVHGTDGGTVQVVLLDEASSLGLYKDTWQGRERVFLTRAGLVVDGDDLRLTSTKRGDLTIGVYPAPPSLVEAGVPAGLFRRYELPAASAADVVAVTFELIHPAGPARAIPLGRTAQPVAAAPDDADFAAAAVWRIQLPRDLDLSTDPLLRVHYVGDAALVRLNGRLLGDDFYNGACWDIGLRRHAPEILGGELHLAILPLRKDAPIYLAAQARPDFGTADSVVALSRLEIVPRYQARLSARRP